MKKPTDRNKERPTMAALQNTLWSNRQATTENSATNGNATTEKMSNEPGALPCFFMPATFAPDSAPHGTLATSWFYIYY